MDCFVRNEYLFFCVIINCFCGFEGNESECCLNDEEFRVIKWFIFFWKNYVWIGKKIRKIDCLLFCLWMFNVGFWIRVII